MRSDSNILLGKPVVKGIWLAVDFILGNYPQYFTKRIRPCSARLLSFIRLRRPIMQPIAASVTA